MKRYGNLWDQVCDRANVELAADNALLESVSVSLTIGNTYWMNYMPHL